MSNDRTFWNNNHPLQELADQLHKLLPARGEVQDTSSPKLERYRKAANVYYDLYNNGLINRARQFKGAFGFPMSDHRRSDGTFSPSLYKIVEARMATIVVNAAAEQLGKLPKGEGEE